MNKVYLQLHENELLGIMGHNGAGKTTFINVLSGYVGADAGGEALLYGQSLVNGSVELRRRIGVVSQFDCLWDELTAKDHMYLFSMIKRVKYTHMEKFFTRRLEGSRTLRLS